MKFNNNPAENIRTEAEKLLTEMMALPPLPIDSLDPAVTMAVFVDIVNGFIKEGAMAAPRIADIIPPCAKLLKMCNERDMLTAAFADCHGKNAAEFMSFPPHCVAGTDEAEIVDELKQAGSFILIPKNSTNGFHEKKFRDLLECHPDIDTFIVTGDCTDICVMQFCLTLKTYFTFRDRAVRIILPLDCTDTYDAPGHGSDFSNLAACKLMKDSGVELVGSVC